MASKWHSKISSQFPLAPKLPLVSAMWPAMQGQTYNITQSGFESLPWFIPFSSCLLSGTAQTSILEPMAKTGQKNYHISKPLLFCAWIKEWRNCPKDQSPFSQRNKTKEERNWVPWICLGTYSLLGGGFGAYHMLEFSLSAQELVSKLWPSPLITCSPLPCFQKGSVPRVQRAAEIQRDKTIQLFLNYPNLQNK